MKRKMLLLLIIIALILLMIAFISIQKNRSHTETYLPNSFAASQPEDDYGNEDAIVDPNQNNSADLHEDGEDNSAIEEEGERLTVQLIAMTDTEEEAEEIAQLYDITLVSYRYGLAGYHTEESPNAVIRRGKENGYPTLSINYKRELY